MQYFILVNDLQQGPLDETQLAQGFRDGIYPAGSLVWTQGMESWKPIEETPIVGISVPELARSLSPPARSPSSSAEKI